MNIEPSHHGLQLLFRVAICDFPIGMINRNDAIVGGLRVNLANLGKQACTQGFVETQDEGQ